MAPAPVRGPQAGGAVRRPRRDSPRGGARGGDPRLHSRGQRAVRQVARRLPGAILVLRDVHDRLPRPPQAHGGRRGPRGALRVGDRLHGSGGAHQGLHGARLRRHSRGASGDRRLRLRPGVHPRRLLQDFRGDGSAREIMDIAPRHRHVQAAQVARGVRRSARGPPRATPPSGRRGPRGASAQTLYSARPIAAGGWPGPTRTRGASRTPRGRRP